MFKHGWTSTHDEDCTAGNCCINVFFSITCVSTQLLQLLTPFGDWGFRAYSISKFHSNSCSWVFSCQNLIPKVAIESFPQSPFHSLSNLSGWVISITPTVAVESFPQSQFHSSSNYQDGLSGQYQDGKFCFPRPFLVPNFDWESRPTKKIILDEMNLRPPVPQAWVLACELKFSQLTEQKFNYVQQFYSEI